MVATTFLNDNELNKKTSNQLINELIEEVREQSKRNWQVIETTITRTPFILSLLKRKQFLWFKTETIHLFELFLEVGGMAPFQCINFYRENNTRSSINTRVSADCVIAYLYGILSGIQDVKRQ